PTGLWRKQATGRRSPCLSSNTGSVDPFERTGMGNHSSQRQTSRLRKSETARLIGDLPLRAEAGARGFVVVEGDGSCGYGGGAIGVAGAFHAAVAAAVSAAISRTAVSVAAPVTVSTAAVTVATA